MASHSYDPPSPILLGLESLSVLERGFFSLAGQCFIPPCTDDSNPALILPGFTASDRSTELQRRLLRRRGYAVHGWGLGTNVGPHPHVLVGLRRRLAELCDRYGRPISVVGWSLGGIYARELAREDPLRVRLVVTLGSPYRFRTGDRGHVSDMYAAVAPEHDPFPARAMPEHESPPLTVPATSVYTRTDGVVRWQACIEPVGRRRENIEVMGTHNGLGFNVAALYAVADRLNQGRAAWKPFVPPPYLRHLFPTPSAGRRA
jgi:pimeloyl-ACP methyl ester carboxylesterase